MIDTEVSIASPSDNMRVYTRISYVALFIIMVALFGAFFAIRYADSEYERDLQTWEVRLGIMADSRQSNIESWVEEHFQGLEKVANNPSLRLYMTELMFSDDAEPGVQERQEEPAEATYLRNYLTVSADRGGFVSRVDGPDVKAGVAYVGTAGIALVDRKGRPLVFTKGMPVIEGELAKFVAGAFSGKRSLKDIFKGPDGQPTIAFAVPVFNVQGDETPDQQIGVILGVKSVKDSLYPLLEIPRTTENTAESMLVRLNGNMVEYLSPLKDGSGPLEKRLDINTANFAAAFALANPLSFAIKRDYVFNKVLVTGREIQGAPWILIHKISYDEALVESDARRTRLVTIFLLIIAFLVVFIIAVWRHGTSVRAAESAERYKRLAEQFRNQERLLRLVTDNQPDAMFIADKNNQYHFSNLEASRIAGIDGDAMIGKTLESVLGSKKALQYATLNHQALDEVKTIWDVHKGVDEVGEKHVYQSKHIPLSKVPSLLTKETIPGVLVVEQDITAVIEERERRERTLNQLVDALVKIVDRRNPFAANHSSRVASVARAIAEEMHLSEVEVETAETAGKLMNIGKILLSSDILTKTGKLSSKEKKEIYESIHAGVEFLKGIEFNGPVVETLRHFQEHWDGSGPKGLNGEDIIVTARIISVANAFVAMISPRAYRASMDRDEVFEVLIESMGKMYDRKVVVALINYCENHEGPHPWEENEVIDA